MEEMTTATHELTTYEPRWGGLRNLLVMVVAILWETIRHPLRDVSIIVVDGRVMKAPLDVADEEA